MTNSELPKQQEDSIDIRKFLVKILANWPFFVISVVIAYSIAYLINRYTEPTYSVSASIMINDDKKGAAEALIPALGRYYSQKNVENEMAILRSYSLARKTLSDLNFEVSYSVIGRVREAKIYKSFFTVIPDTLLETKKYFPINISVVSSSEYEMEIANPYNIRKKLKFGEKFSHPDFNFTLVLNDPYFKYSNNISKAKYIFYLNDLNSLTNYYRAKISISANDKKSTVLTLTTSGPVAQQETDYLNQLCETYIKSGLEDKNRVSTNTIKFIDLQLGQISDSLKRAELRLQNFRLENKIIDISKEGAATYSKVEELLSQKAILETQLRYFNYLKEYIESKTDFNDIIAPSVMGINEPLLNQLVGSLTDLYKQKAGISYSAQANSPSLNMLNLKMTKNIDALKENIKEIIHSTKLNINSLENRINKEEIDLQKLPVTERNLINIKREFDVNNNIFTFLLQKRAEAGIARASNVADNRVLDEARVDNATQISPKRSKNYMMALLLGILIPLAVIFLIEMFNTRITDLKELDKLKRCNVIGSIGHNDKMTDLPVFERPKSALAESFRSLRTNLQYLLRQNNEKVILITSTISGEGKTFCAINLAAILAMSNKKVILLALDLRKPRIHKLFDIDNEIGISTYLINQNKKEDIIFETNVKNLYLMPSGPVPPNPAELIETERMDQLIESLKDDFDYIILDTPPIAIVTDALLLAKYSNTNIFVVRHNYSSKDVLNLADELAEKEAINHLNILVNDVKIPGYYGHSYRYGYRYGYGYQYGYGYSYYSYGQEYYGDIEKPKTITEKIKKWLGG